uniref:Uncharacterized protein n=1 Tax=Glossina palpalis gambiensis TaxID=67801 RepID=A0A1B0B9V0_9MUSC
YASLNTKLSKHYISVPRSVTLKEHSVKKLKQKDYMFPYGLFIEICEKNWQSFVKKRIYRKGKIEACSNEEDYILDKVMIYISKMQNELRIVLQRARKKQRKIQETITDSHLTCRKHSRIENFLFFISEIYKCTPCVFIIFIMTMSRCTYSGFKSTKSLEESMTRIVQNTAGESVSWLQSQWMRFLKINLIRCPIKLL